MSRNLQKVFMIILMIVFILFNILHLIFPVELIIEDIKAETMHGTGLDIGVVVPWIIEFLSLPIVIFQVIIYILSRKNKYHHIGNIVSFSFFIFQVVFFNILLLF